MPAISLSKSTGEQVNLTSKKLEQWFAQVEKDERSHSNVSDEHLSTQFLGRFGLKSPIDVLTFLHSPAGETVRKMIAEKLAEIAAMEAHQYKQMQQEQARHFRMLAFLLLGLMYKHDAKAHKLNELIQQQIDKLLHKLSSTSKENQSSGVTETVEALSKQISHYDTTAKILEADLNLKVAEKQALELELKALQLQGNDIKEKHEILMKSMEKLVAFLANAGPGSAVQPSPQRLSDEILALENKFESRAAKISELINDVHNDEARRLIHKNHALHMRIDGIRDMLAVLNNEKKFYTIDGQQTDSFNDAAFVLVPQQRVVKANGQFYVIGIRESLDDMDDTTKNEAKLRFDRLQPEISSVKNQVHHHCKLESQFHRQSLAMVQSRLENLPKEIEVLTQQLEKVRAAKSSLEAELKKQNPDLRRVKNLQHSTTKVSTSSVSPSISNAGSVQHALDRLIAGPATAANINNFNNAYRASGGNPKGLGQAMGQIKAGDRIPRQTMLFLQKMVNSLHTPATEKLDEIASPTPSPTPFSMSPSPFKK